MDSRTSRPALLLLLLLQAMLQQLQNSSTSTDLQL
jgi:hypothetical protein